MTRSYAIRGEGRHALTKRLFFGNEGVFRTGEADELMNKVSALSVLSNAVLVWNTTRIAEIVAALEKASGHMSDLGFTKTHFSAARVRRQLVQRIEFQNAQVPSWISGAVWRDRRRARLQR